MTKPLVEYFTVELAPHLQMFKCERMRATLSVQSCAANWRGSHDELAERMFRCKTCPIGAVHAGETAASLSPLRGAMICGRCHRGTTRLIEQHLCPSCWNRERETIIGKNAKGVKPVKLASVHPRALRVIEAGEPKLIKRQRTAHIEELYVKALRDCARTIVFTWDPHRPALFSQRRLW